jgi:hypothetical protein
VCVVSRRRGDEKRKEGFAHGAGIQSLLFSPSPRSPGTKDARDSLGCSRSNVRLRATKMILG